MMYLTKVSLWDVVKKQLRYKLKSYRGVYTSLMVLQLIAILFSLGGEVSSGGGSENFHYSLRYFTGNLVLVFMMIWAFISAIVVTTQAYRFDDFSFVTNRLSSHLSNILFLAAASILGGITVLLASQLLKLLVFMFQDLEYISNSPLTAQQVITGLLAMILYLFLFTAIGYLVGILVQKNKIFIVILPALFFGVIFLAALLSEQPNVLMDLGLFFGGETSFLLFTVKVLLISLLSYGLSMLISNRMEVRS